MQTLTAELAVQLFDHAPMGVALAGADGAITWCNKTLEVYLGHPAAQLLGRPAATLGGDGIEAADELGVVVVRARDNRRERWLRSFSAPLAGALQATYFLDISNEEAIRHERDDLARQVRNEATIDTVSGLLNRRTALQTLEPLVSRSRRYQNPLSVITLGLTNYRDLTGRHGRTIADQVVEQIGQVLKDKMRWADVIGRIDPETFLLVLPETDAAAAQALTDKLVKDLRDSQHGNGTEPRVCFGIASWNKGDDATLLLNHSRQAMESARNQGPFAVARHA